MHNVCLTKDGKVITFGCNDEGALGRATTVEGSETFPGFVDLPAPAIQVTAGDSHSAALLSDGRVFAWGSFRASINALDSIFQIFIKYYNLILSKGFTWNHGFIYKKE